MGVDNIFAHSRFDKSYKKLPKEVKEKAKLKEKIFRKGPFDFSVQCRTLQSCLFKKLGDYPKICYRGMFKTRL